MTKKVFITGATGYIGGEVLYQLLNNKDTANFEITALVRSDKKAANLKSKTKNKVKTVIGTLDDIDLIKDQAARSDIIINTADVDNVPSAQAISDALVASITPKILIHTSGTSILGDGLAAKKPPAIKIYSDSENIDEINALDSKQPHRPVDEIVLDIHDKNPKIQTVIICPSTIYGISKGYDNIISIQIPFLIRSILKYKKAFSVYDGNYIWSRIHIKDLGELYQLLLVSILTNKHVPINKEGYYFGSLTTKDVPGNAKPTDIEHTWRQISEAIGQKLYERKLISSPEVEELEPSKIIDLTDEEFAPFYWGTNSRSRGDNGVKFGWTPKFTSRKEFFDSIDDDIDYILKHD
ncbi:hypothetical protein DFJ63DRAFT_313982 [Scheffersomyces coipomensis]|uniref:uncharacterized protein n=1 Tax=Scheffersomyces coipomensis TaxID=1788519 RepID=UPI00315D8123